MQNFIIPGLQLSTPLLLAAIGDLYAEKSGVLNLGIEATMIMGAYLAYHFAFLSCFSSSLSLPSGAPPWG